jgi:hypothetical protein
MNHAIHAWQQAAPRARRGLESRRGERGLTLVELLIAALIASLLIGFVFDIQGRMSGAFRSQINVGSLQQGVRAANELIARDARLAGFMLPDGVHVSSRFPLPETAPGLVVQDADGFNFVPALAVFNNPRNMPSNRMQPDLVHFFYADPNPLTHAVVEKVAGSIVTVDNAILFQEQDLVVFAKRDPAAPVHPLGNNMPTPARYFACMVRISALGPGPNQLMFLDDPIDPFNTAANEHCHITSATQQPAMAEGAQVFRIVAHAYRIDTTATRESVGALEISRTGGLTAGQGEDWSVVGIGFVDLQISQRRVEAVSDNQDPDGDGNARADWYSSAGPFPANAALTQLGISLAARTVRQVEGVTARAGDIPVLTSRDAAGNPIGDPAHNPIGDAQGPKDLNVPEFDGDYVYRELSTIVDIRNLGVAY